MKKSLIALLVLILGACSVSEQTSNTATPEEQLQEFISQSKGFYSIGGELLEVRSDGSIYNLNAKAYSFEKQINKDQAVYSKVAITRTQAKEYVGVSFVDNKMQFYNKGGSSTWSSLDEVSFDTAHKGQASDPKLSPIEGALTDALNRLSSTYQQGTTWERVFTDHDTDENNNKITEETTYRLILGTKTFGDIRIQKFNGTETDNDGIPTTYDNEIISKFTLGGSLIIQNIDNNTPIFITGTQTQVTDLKDYNKIHTLTPVETKQWFLETEKWEDGVLGQGENLYYLSKEVESKLYLIRLDKIEDKFVMRSSEILEDNNSTANIYTKVNP